MMAPEAHVRDIMREALWKKKKETNLLVIQAWHFVGSHQIPVEQGEWNASTRVEVRLQHRPQSGSIGT